MISCRSCGRRVGANDEFCKYCGSKLGGELSDEIQMQEEIGSTEEDDATSWTAEDVKQICEDITTECEEIQIEFNNNVIRIRKAVQGEIRWGGLFFDPQDIGKKLVQLQEYYKWLFEQGQPLGMSTDLLKVRTWQMAHPPRETPDCEEIDQLAEKASQAVSAVEAQVSDIGEWMENFYAALCTTGTARALLPLLPGFAYEEEEPTRSSSKPAGFFDWLLGRK